MIDTKILKPFAAKSSRRDVRDYKFQKARIPTRESIDLREYDSVVEDQGYLGSCVGNAITNAYEIELKKFYPEKFVELNRLFVYYNARWLEGTVLDDYGTSIRSGLRGVYYYGVCTEEIWPYDITKFDEKPSDDAYEEAKSRYITEYYHLYDIADSIDAISMFQPPVIGIEIYENFLDLNETSYVVTMPSFGNSYYGLHAMTLVGYNINERYFIAKNSFGKSWGNYGYCYIPFDYYEKYVTESWSFTISDQVSSLI